MESPSHEADGFRCHLKKAYRPLLIRPPHPDLRHPGWFTRWTRTCAFLPPLVPLPLLGGPSHSSWPSVRPPTPHSGPRARALRGLATCTYRVKRCFCFNLCLPFIRAIGSRRPPEVFVMEPTDAWHLHDPAHARRLHTPRLGCVSFAKTPSGAK